MIDIESILAEIISNSTIASANIFCENGGVSDRATATATAEKGEPKSTTAPRKTPHGEAWGALTRTHAAVTQRLQDALARAEFPPLPWYEVLATVADAPEQRLRMGELAEALVITRGGLTKLVDRLIKAGLLERTFCETDRRVSYATLLPTGADLLAEMRPVVTEELAVAFSANLSAPQAKELRQMLERVRSSACGVS